jgi:shikimate dehydrogenase
VVTPYAEVIGDPVSHSKSPVIHKFWLAKLGLDYEYRATRVPLENLVEFIEQRRCDPDWCGANVTMPLKIAAAGLVDELSPEAFKAGAVNCIVRRGSSEPRLVGHNGDLLAIGELLKDWRAVGEISAHLLGTGGAASAAAIALMQHPDAPGIAVYGRTIESATEFALRHDIYDQDGAAYYSHTLASLSSGEVRIRSRAPSLLINATPLGMTGQNAICANLDFLQPGSTVFDMVYDPVETALLRAARERGLKTIDGLEMLVEQAASAFEMFFGQPAPREHDAELRALLVAR